LLWAQRRLVGSLVLVVVFAIGVIGSLEHFFIPGPNNVFDAGVGDVAFLFRFSVAPLLVLGISGLWGAARLIRSVWRKQREPVAVDGRHERREQPVSEANR
jgi:ABC-type dipeptide/oligopeptide/nickel transport system permease component